MSKSASKFPVHKFLLLAILLTTAAPRVAAQNVIQLPDSLYTTGDTIVWVKRVPAYCEGPAWEPATGSVYFTQQGANSSPNWPIHRVKPGVDTGIIWYAFRQNNGIEFDKQGRLHVAQDGRISRLKQAAVGDSGVIDSIMVTSGTNGVTFSQSNDLSIGSNGGIYFTALSNFVYYLTPARQLFTVSTNITQANGIEWIEEQKAVYVNSTSGGVYRFAIDSTKDTLINRTTFLSTTAMPGTDGGCVDSHGNRWVASYSQGQVRVFNANGDSIGRISLGNPPGSFNNRGGVAGNADNCAFGGSDRKTLFITGDGGLYSLKVKVAGRPPAQGPVSIRALPYKAAKAPDAGVLGEARDLRGRVLPEEFRGPVLKSYPVGKKEE
jgi:gluconolactonase